MNYSLAGTYSNHRTFKPDEELSPNITIGRESLPIAIKHGLELWWDESTPTARLDDRDGSSKFSRYVNSRVEGKLCEVAFADFLQQQFGLDSAVDWRIYGDYETTDDGDLQYLENDDGDEFDLSSELEIKKTKPWNSWLAIRDCSFDRIPDDAPIVLTKMRIEDDINVDPWIDVGDWSTVDEDDEFRRRLLAFADDAFPVDVELVGTAYKDEFSEHFSKGDRLYDPINGTKLGAPLKRNNHGMFVDNLNNTAARWNRVVSDIVQNADATDWHPLPIVDSGDEL